MVVSTDEATRNNSCSNGSMQWGCREEAQKIMERGRNMQAARHQGVRSHGGRCIEPQQGSACLSPSPLPAEMTQQESPAFVLFHLCQPSTVNSSRSA